MNRDLDAVARATAWPRRPLATRNAAGALCLRQPDGTSLWVARPGAVETLDRWRLRRIMSGATLDLAADDGATFDE